METLLNPQLTTDQCYVIIDGSEHEIYEDQSGAFYIIDFDNGNQVVYLTFK